MKYLISILTVVILAAGLQSVCMATENLALGKTVTFDTQPNYGGSTDPDDRLQLTDGKRAGEGFWMDKGAVGWVARPEVYITLDLGKVQPISKVVFSTAARATADVHWPASVYAHVSDDGATYHYLGNMVVDALKSGKLEPTDATDQRIDLSLERLQTHGRYVIISIISKGPYVFTDEIEVYRGDSSFLNEPLPGEGVANLRDFVRASAYKVAVSERLDLTINELRDRIKSAKVSAASKAAMNAKLNLYEKQILDLPTSRPPNFKAIIPVNEIESSLMAVNADLMRALGYKPLSIWKKHRYDRLMIFEQPNKNKAAISIDAMRNEFRADSFLISNYSSQSQTITMTISGLPGSPAPRYLEVSAIPWTDTSRRQPVASALPAQAPLGNVFRVDVPAGMTRTVWFTLNSSLLGAGNYKGTLNLTTGVWSQKVPINIRVSKLAIARPRMSLGMWDYTQGRGYEALNSVNIPSAIQMMTSHYVDAPWATPGTVPIEDNLTAQSFRAFDDWVKMWPDARRYMVFQNVPNSFTGSMVDTPEFAAKVATWARSLEAHMKSLGKDPKMLTFLLLDEPSTDAQDEIIAAWAKAIRSSGANISTFQDPVWQDPAKNKIQEAITLIDVVCPMLNIYYRGGDAARRYYQSIRERGGDMWFYQCIGPVRTFDPAEYYRITAWHAFKAGAVGMGFWAFGDLGGLQSSWDEYVTGGVAFAPAFIDPETVTDSVHWQAVREGILDYEYLAMLKDAIASSRDIKLKDGAGKLLDQAVQSVTANYKEDFEWKSGPRHQMVDDYRIRVLRMLEKF